MGECKDKQKKITILKQTINIIKEDTEDYHWTMFTCAIDFSKECANLKKPIPKHFFTGLLNDLLTKHLITLGNLLSIEFLKPQRWFYATLGKQAWLPQDLRNKILKPSVNCQMIGLTPKPQDVYDSWKKWWINNWRRKKNTIVCNKLWNNVSVKMNIG